MKLNDIRRIIIAPANGFALGVGLVMAAAARWVFNSELCFPLVDVFIHLEDFRKAAEPGEGVLTWAFILMGLLFLGLFGIAVLVVRIGREVRHTWSAALTGNWTPGAALFTAIVVTALMALLWDNANDQLWECFHVERMDRAFYQGDSKLWLRHLATVFAALWMVRVAYLSGLLRRLSEDDSHIRDRVGEFTRIRRELHMLLLLIGWFILLATVNTAIERTIVQDAFRAAKVAAGDSAAAKKAFIPFDIVTYLGLMHTALVIAFMGPAYYQLRATGGKLVSIAFGDSPAPEADWSDWTSDRAAMEDYLGLSKGLRELLTAGLPALTPLIGAILSQFLKF